jgi:hypothetical protein
MNVPTCAEPIVIGAVNGAPMRLKPLLKLTAVSENVPMSGAIVTVPAAVTRFTYNTNVALLMLAGKRAPGSVPRENWTRPVPPPPTNIEVADPAFAVTLVLVIYASAVRTASSARA